ncbi:MAG: hypothetical protein ACRCZL_08715 [Cetobacterium sp.]
MSFKVGDRVLIKSLADEEYDEFEEKLGIPKYFDEAYENDYAGVVKEMSVNEHGDTEIYISFANRRGFWVLESMLKPSNIYNKVNEIEVSCCSNCSSFTKGTEACLKLNESIVKPNYSICLEYTKRREK